HSSQSPGAGSQATASTAAFGQALSTLSSLHHRITAIEPGLCPVDLTTMDFAHTPDGTTGIRPGRPPHLPNPVGKVAGGRSRAGVGEDEPKLRRKLAKAQKRIGELEAENAILGALPSVDDAPYRGIPELSGPVDRKSLVGKAVGGGADDNQADDQEYIDYL